MRRATYLLPRAEGDPADGEVVIFDSHTLSGGGGIDDNFARWRGMMKTADGAAVPESAAKREDFEKDGVKVAMMEVPGKYTPSAMGPTPPAGPVDNALMLAAVVQVNGTSIYIRGTGPTATMEKHRADFRALLESIRPQ
jgi:hypothetical protein